MWKTGIILQVYKSRMSRAAMKQIERVTDLKLSLSLNTCFPIKQLFPSSQQLFVCLQLGEQVRQLMTKSRLRDGTEPAVFVLEVAKQHDVFAGAIAFGVLALVSDWIKRFGNSSSASTKIYQNWHLFPRLCYKLIKTK